MTNRERALAVLRYQNYDRLPIVHFGYWTETLQKWVHDGHLQADEIERLRPLVALGGYIPCPDHRIPPDAQWDNVRYYCDQMRKVFD